MTYVEKMVMKIMGEMGYNYGNQQETKQIVQQIIADTKRADKKAYSEWYGWRDTQSACMDRIDEAEVEGGEG